MNLLREGILANKIASVLLLTIVLGMIADKHTPTSEKFIHPTGREGHVLHYFFYFNVKYLIEFILVLGYLIPNRSRNDVIVIYCYLFFDLIGWALYNYNGWPEAKDMIIVHFGLTLVLFFFVKRFWKGDYAN